MGEWLRTYAARFEQLRRLANSGDTVALAIELRPLLQEDFGRWFATLRVQKFISQLRSTDRIRALRSAVLTPELRQSVSVREVAVLEHHFNVCEFMQEVFAHIDTEAVSLACDVAHPDNLARAVARMIEMANFVFQRRVVPDGGPSPHAVSILELTHLDRQLRSILDTGIIILNSEAAKNGTDTGYAIHDADLSELGRLALLYDEMRQALDLYTYQEADVHINRKSLVVSVKERAADIAAAVGAERAADHDQVRQNILSLAEATVHDECRSIPVGDSDTFFTFLQKVGSGAAGASARQFGRAFATDLEIEIGDFFDLAAEVTTKSGRFTVRELVRAWAFLATVALLGQRWNERHVNLDAGPPPPGRGQGSPARIVRDVPVPELRKAWLVRILSSEAGLSREQARNLINQFASLPARGRIDLFYRPLMLLSGDAVILPTPYIRGSRFERNLFTLIATETDFDQKRKGYLPVLDLRRRFENAGFQALANFRVQVNHKELTDIDLVAFKDGILFLGQCKIVIEPDNLYDTWKAQGKLEFAAGQLDTCILHLGEVRSTLFERLRLKGITEETVVPFILTNTRQFTERQFRGHPVVDIAYLRFILAGARQAIIGIQSGKIGVGSGRSYIEGKSPTGGEFATLLKDTIHNVRDRKVTYSHVMRKVGDRKVHLPMMGMQTPGESRYVFTRNELFDNDEPLQPWMRGRN